MQGQRGDPCNGYLSPNRSRQWNFTPEGRLCQALAVQFMHIPEGPPFFNAHYWRHHAKFNNGKAGGTEICRAGNELCLSASDAGTRRACALWVRDSNPGVTSSYITLHSFRYLLSCAHG